MSSLGSTRLSVESADATTPVPLLVVFAGVWSPVDWVSVFGCDCPVSSFDAWAGVPPELIGSTPMPPSRAMAVTATDAPAVASRP